MTGPGPGSWQPDPEGRFEYRWWDGQGWTDQVYHRGQSGTVPLSGAPQSAPRQGEAPQATAVGQPAGDAFGGIDPSARSGH